MSVWLQARNILAVRLDNIGDVVMLGPSLRAVKESSPKARITLLATPAGASAAPLLPWVDDVIIWRPVWQDVGNRMPLDPNRERELIDLLAARNFDAAMIFSSFSQTPHPPGYVCYLAGIPLRAGESKEFGGSILTNELKAAPDDLHQAERNLRLVEQLGFTVRERRLAVSIPDEARAAAPELLRQAGINPDEPFILLHPGASCSARRYPPERFGVVARQLREQGWQVLVTGVEREEDLIETVQQQAPGVPTIVGQSTLAEYAALIERASVVLCGNTLPIHLADALGTPVVATYSGTDYEEQWRPRAVPSRLLRRPTPCHPCYLFECPIGLPCLDIPEEEVVEAVEGLVGAPAEDVSAIRGDRGARDNRTPNDSINRSPEAKPEEGRLGGLTLRPTAHRLSPTPAQTTVRRIAVIRALQLGDMLVAVPALRSLRAGFPDAEITLIGLPWARSFCQRFSHLIDRFVEFAGYPGIAEVEVVPERTERFLRQQQAEQYDLVIQMHGSGRTSTPLALDLGGQMTAGYYEGAMPEGLDIGAPYPSYLPEVLRNLHLVLRLGCPDLGTDLEFPLLNEDWAEADALLRDFEGTGPLIGIHAGARPQARRWMPERFAAVADHFAQHIGARIVLTGGPGEEETVGRVADRMTSSVLNLAGQTSIGGLAALIKRFDLFISNDTGPAHLAVAVDTPSVRIFGPADHTRWAPLDNRRHPYVRVQVECNPCLHDECPIDHRCLHLLKPQMVIDAASRLILTGTGRPQYLPLTPVTRHPGEGGIFSVVPNASRRGSAQDDRMLADSAPDGSRGRNSRQDHNGPPSSTDADTDMSGIHPAATGKAEGSVWRT